MFWSSTTARRCTAHMAITTGARAACCGGSSSRATARVSCDRPRRKNQAQIREGNRLRDSRQYAAAAEAYAAVLTLAPERTDIRVQYANMLKDARRPAEAEAIYRQALAEAPADSDIHLQLGHALKLQGRHNEAVAAYRQAAAGQCGSAARIVFRRLLR